MSDQPGLMAGKRGLIMGVANDHSIAWGIARRLAAAGAELAFTFQPPSLDQFDEVILPDFKFRNHLRERP